MCMTLFACEADVCMYVCMHACMYVCIRVAAIWVSTDYLISNFKCRYRSDISIFASQCVPQFL